VDPVTIITAALTAGAVGSASGAARDAYATLQTLVQRRLAERSDGEVVLRQHAAKPNLWAPVLEAELAEACAGEDTALVEAAQQLLDVLDPDAPSGKYAVDLRGAQGVQVGDRNIQTNTFSPGPTNQ
jgi:hypothetical protein